MIPVQPTLTLLAASLVVACTRRADVSTFPALVTQCNRAAADSLVSALKAQQEGEPSSAQGSPKMLQPGRQRYPSKLYTRGIGGRVEFEYVVQVDGSVDPCTIRPLSYTNEAFVLPGSEMLAASQFAVPLRNGVPAPVLMRQALNWRVAD